ncbi:VOC family protein [Psychrosphaera sp. B3R10]|uniref:VOC family protein n=1 Tax=Psychrosphaera algicola TaxID=3023714 RepID=A0ABT5FE35_9GAMM|nr:MULTISPECIES: VOC family protein [unclassified Psychrosphaera]MBU2883351.1 VOC family protein [Psychrosphaera sp. I2R16]MBU2990555.1 VOC family protein [Psychrosphaera sp. B3R10]MDC2889803.1 VOC family protein [Psychrosphaera sp. G1-22]
MKLGAFSVSLAVKDLAKSKAFYENLGFTVFGGVEHQNWLILKNGDHIIGLFQGMFESNIMTFNPGWDQDAQALAEFDDVRAIQNHLQQAGCELDSTVDPDSKGPASFALKDPDGNVILIDQHV